MLRIGENNRFLGCARNDIFNDVRRQIAKGVRYLNFQRVFV